MNYGMYSRDDFQVGDRVIPFKRIDASWDSKRYIKEGGCWQFKEAVRR